MKFLLDTNVISELVARTPNPTVVAWLDACDPNNVYLSVLTIGELRKGIEKLPDSPRKTALIAWLQDELLIRFSGRILELSIEVMLTWGALTARLERVGRPLAAIDSLIAALALHHHCTLITCNTTDFDGTGVTIVNPWA